MLFMIRTMAPLTLLVTLLGVSACGAKQDAVVTNANANAHTTDQSAIVGGNAPGAFATIQAALDAAPKDETLRYRILITAGSYKEKLVITRPNMEIRGEGEAKTVIHFDTYAGNSKGYREDGWGTPGSAVVAINTTDIHLEDLTIDNTFDFLDNDAKKTRNDPDAVADSQAVALLLDTASDRISANRVSLHGYQDTLFVHGNRAYFYQSTISGNVDFIFGQANTVFEQSTIVSRPRNSTFEEGEIHSFVTAPSTNIGREYGLTFIDSKLTREDGVPDNSITLGRPWHPTTTFADGRYADPDAIGKAVFIRTFMDSHINPVGWSSMSGTAPDGTKSRIFTPEESRFFEYKSTGPGAVVNAQRPQLSDSEAAAYTLENIFQDWQPKK